MIGNCKTCKHWEQNPPGNERPDWGACDMFNTEDDELLKPYALARANASGKDAFDSYGDLETSALFGCVQWSPEN